METSFLTIAEAAAKTGRSLSTIRRIIRTITDTASHPDRDGVRPTVEEATALKKKNEIFSWRISEEVLERQLQSAPKEGKKTTKHSPPPERDILSILSKELELKNEQIAKQWEVIHALNDRLREGNILMGSLQQRLALPEHSKESSKHVEAMAVKSSKESSVEGSTRSATKPSKTPSTGGDKKASMKDSKKGMFGWLFR